MLTSEQVMGNIVSHGACVEGVAWAVGKDSNAIWAATDEMAAPYLFWWAVQNAGQPGWHPTTDILSTLSALMGMYDDYNEVNQSILAAEFALIGSNSFTEDSLKFYSRIEQVVRWKNPDPAVTTAFRIKILPTIKAALTPSI
jgi:hypothetical protein